ncbi:MAG: ribosomal RNA small subunit methyltransferase A [Opitutales bacterium]|nr:ribosomal RNA small subunit methyltransferase A [Opitutales bacterium]MCH8540671.1 16S rRNA (adenine(1518)-N(6)/adenine(1519)-N(6))-dimethyltransferase RsmA [Opitutales bacterium]
MKPGNDKVDPHYRPAKSPSHPPFLDTRAILRRIEHSPIRKLGQNFLTDPNIIRKSLELAQITDKDLVVEIGPGLGTLTRALLQQGATVQAVEKDPTLAQWLRDDLCPQYPDTFHLIEGDALDFPSAGLGDQADYKIVANLPYAISTPWIERVLALPNLPSVMVLMLQKETADRFAASSGTKHFSAITILLQMAYTFAPGHRVSARCFHPVPKVDSYLLPLRQKAEPVFFDEDQKNLLRQVFTQRRKQLGGLLRKLVPQIPANEWESFLRKQGFSQQSRPEDLPPTIWVKLLRLRAESLSGGEPPPTANS